jgi:MFS family permease
MVLNFKKGLGLGLVYVPSIVSVGFYFEKNHSFAMGIAVCGSGLGAFVFSPINRILIDFFDVDGSFLIISALLLNLIPCGLVIRPVPIEPAEKAKKKKRALKQINKSRDTDLEASKLNEVDVENKTKRKSSFLKRTIHSLFDFTLFYDVLFMFFALSNFLTSLGFNAPYIFIVDQAISVGIEKHKADYLVSAIGIDFLNI